MRSVPLNTKEASPAPESVFAEVEGQTGAVWLDDGSPKSGWTILAWRPEDIVTDGRGWPEAGRRLTGSGLPSDLPFTSGCIGYIGYHAAHRTLPVPPSLPCREPEVWLGRYRGSLCYRHRDRQWFASGDDAFIEEARAVVQRASPLPEPASAPPQTSSSSWSAEAYQEAIQKILGLLHEGDCYQVNLSRVVHVAAALDPWECYRRLRRASSAGYGALLNIGEQRILSSSPELLMGVSGQEACSIPIKGTRPRGADAQDDLVLMKELLDSPKEQAELTIIVDLVRNDLGRVAVPGTVRTDTRTVIKQPYVHHAHQAVYARLREAADPWDCLEALFPAGSVTGAPKIRACKRIHELEPEGRGVYCGAIGYVSANGTAQWSVAIRTAVHHPDHLRFHVGGGIVEASQAEAEWAETVHKARAMAQAFTGASSA
jgi:para-aminobenzoate synthetase component I